MRLLLPLAGIVLSVSVGCAQGESLSAGGTGGGAGTYHGGDEAGTGDNGDPEGDKPIVGADDSNTKPGTAADAGTPAPTGDAGPAATTLVTTTNVNLRSGPATTYSILAVIPAGSTVILLNPTPNGGFLNVDFNGTDGWASAQYLTASSASGGDAGGAGDGGGTVDVNGSPSPDNAVARAAASVGFSYFWGGGAWLATGPTSSTAGSCSGSCPTCTHSGQYGADCSGMVAKAWQFGPEALDQNAHPYSTTSFVSDVAGQWTTVSRDTLKKGDALVYNSGGSGHIVLWESGDPWGASTVYECRGCSYGCVHDTRTFGTEYHGIRRAGF